MARKLLVICAAVSLTVATALAQQNPPSQTTPNQSPGGSPQTQCWDAATNQARDRGHLPNASISPRETVGAGQQPAGVNESQRSPGVPATRPAGIPNCQ
jgi:hypothetical protein